MQTSSLLGTLCKGKGRLFAIPGSMFTTPLLKKNDIMLEEIKNSSASCVMDFSKNHRLLCQLTLKLQYYDLSLE